VWRLNARSICQRTRQRPSTSGAASTATGSVVKTITKCAAPSDRRSSRSASNTSPFRIGVRSSRFPPWTFVSSHQSHVAADPDVKNEVNASGAGPSVAARSPPCSTRTSRGYFDAIVREQLIALVERRFGDGSLLRLIRKWLHVGVLEAGRLLITGTGQGQVSSPLLANICLHDVLDEWFEQVVRPCQRRSTSSASHTYGRPTTYHGLWQCYRVVRRLWRKWLDRRRPDYGDATRARSRTRRIQPGANLRSGRGLSYSEERAACPAGASHSSLAIHARALFLSADASRALAASPARRIWETRRSNAEISACRSRRRRAESCATVAPQPRDGNSRRVRW